MSRASFKGKIIKDEHKGGWTYVVWPESKSFFNTGMPVNATAEIADHSFDVTFMPFGSKHMTPIKKEVTAKLELMAGDSVLVSIIEKSTNGVRA